MKFCEQFSADERRRVNDAVAAAEAQTGAEIVPVVAFASGRYDRAEDVVGLWCGVIALAAAWLALPSEPQGAGSWAAPSPLIQLLVLIVAVTAGFILGVMLAERVWWLRALFVPKEQMRDEVAAAARRLFYDRRVHHTTGSTGVLLYVSLFERTAAVIGDETVLDKLGQAFFDRLCRQLTAELQQRSATEALSLVIATAGETLGAALPREAGKVNELPDALVVVEGWGETGDVVDGFGGTVRRSV